MATPALGMVFPRNEAVDKATYKKRKRKVSVNKTTHWLKYNNFLRIETIHDDLVNLNPDQLFGHVKQ